jgi:hypothetical protein
MVRVGWMLAFAAVACGGEETAKPAAAACSGVELIVAAGNYESSTVCGAPGCVKQDGVTTGIDLGVDPILSESNGRAFFLARDNDKIFELDPSCGTPQRSFKLEGLARPGLDGKPMPANPHDVAAAPDGTLIVPLYTAGKLAFIAPDRTVTPLDLAPYDADGNPQPESIRIVPVGGVPKAFVALERLDDSDQELPSRQSSQMLRIDVATRAVEAVIEFKGRNPFNTMAEHAGAIFLAMPGDMFAAGDAFAGIERFETSTGETRLIVQESDLDGSVIEVAVTDGCGAAIVAGPETNVNPTSVITFNPDTGQIGGPIIGPTAGFDLQGLAWKGNTLYVGDRRQTPDGFAVHVFERRDGCTLADTGRTLLLPDRPIALRAAR